MNKGGKKTLDCQLTENVFDTLQLGLPSTFFDELLFNIIDSIDWQSFKVTDLLKKEWQRGQIKSKKSLPCQKLTQLCRDRTDTTQQHITATQHTCSTPKLISTNKQTTLSLTITSLTYSKVK